MWAPSSIFFSLPFIYFSLLFVVCFTSNWCRTSFRAIQLAGRANSKTVKKKKRTWQQEKQTYKTFKKSAKSENAKQKKNMRRVLLALRKVFDSTNTQKTAVDSSFSSYVLLGSHIFTSESSSRYWSSAEGFTRSVEGFRTQRTPKNICSVKLSLQPTKTFRQSKKSL